MALDKKEIALSVGGVLASMVLAWLLYRLQQKDAAASAAQNAQNIQDEELAAQSQLAQQYSSGASTSSVASIPAISTQTTSTAPVTGNTDDSTAALLAAIIAEFGTEENSSTESQQENPISSLLLPVEGVESSPVSGVATTAATALQQVDTTLGGEGNNVLFGGNYSDTSITTPTVSVSTKKPVSNTFAGLNA